MDQELRHLLSSRAEREALVAIRGAERELGWNNGEDGGSVRPTGSWTKFGTTTGRSCLHQKLSDDLSHTWENI